MQTKFNYTSGGDFTRSDDFTNYVGYFNLNDNGNVYTEKYYNLESSVLLNPASNASTDYHRSNHFKDRYILINKLIFYF
jgi:hypothetical protein